MLVFREPVLYAPAIARSVLGDGGGCGCGSDVRLRESGVVGELQRGVQSLGALAAQGQLIADGTARDATKQTYVRVMSRTLGEEAPA